MARTEFDGGWVESTLSGGEVRVNTNPAGLIDRTSDGTDGSSLTVAPDGTTTSETLGPDQRFGMQAPVLKEMTITTPGGLVATVSTFQYTRSTEPSDSQEPSRLLSQDESIAINDAWYDNSYDASTRTFTALTPEGRSSTTRLDSLGRVIEESTPGITPVERHYDARGRLAQVVQGSRTWIYAYGPDGRLASVTDPLSRTNSYSYDAAGRITLRTLPDGRQLRI